MLTFKSITSHCISSLWPIMQVVNDGEMQLWRELGVNSWPTFAIVGPEGKLIAQLAGEGRRKVFLVLL